MSRSTQTHLQDVLDLWETSVQTDAANGRVITDFVHLRTEVAPQLAMNCALGPEEVRQKSLELVWWLSEMIGMPYVAAEAILSPMLRDNHVSFRIPVVDIIHLPFEMARIIFDAANNMEVGPLIFRMDTATDNNAGRVAAVMMAALAENFQAPILFADASSELPSSFHAVGWQEWLFDERDDVSRDGQMTVLGDAAEIPALAVTRAQWDAIFATGDDHWEFIREDISDICGDFFEMLEVNETFSVLKRYVIPVPSAANPLLAL
ncbi:MAG: hypothetical protein M0R76_03730 [Proteobacteria bacterium]|nr:hypothetical protein [Pseudomonadota bacterium]